MQYKYDKKIKFYRIKYMHRQRYTLLGSVGLLAVALGMLGIFKFCSSNLSQFFGLSGKHTTGVDDSMYREHHHKSGSNAPAPKGIVLDTLKRGVPMSPLRQDSCDGFLPAHTGLENSNVPELRKLAQYEQLCHGAVADRASFFISTPTTVQEARSSGQWVANTLKAYADNGIKPLVFMEPTAENGGNLDLNLIANGRCDQALSAFYQTIKSSGVSSDAMGMWVYLPEGNLPAWSTVDPSVYTKVISRMATLQKQVFPDSLVSVMLDSESYAPGASWGCGKYVSLLPYVQNLPKGLIDSFGLQGFPWSSPANQSDAPLNDPKTYLQINFAMEAARKLGIKNIWFNTGTFHEMYAGQSAQTIYETDVHRQQELDGVLQLAGEVNNQGFSVSIHLFSQNKASLAEGTDWSYWNKNPGDSPSTYVFATFAHDAQAAGIPIWLYDTEAAD